MHRLSWIRKKTNESNALDEIFIENQGNSRRTEWKEEAKLFQLVWFEYKWLAFNWRFYLSYQLKWAEKSDEKNVGHIIKIPRINLNNRNSHFIVLMLMLMLLCWAWHFKSNLIYAKEINARRKTYKYQSFNCILFFVLFCFLVCGAYYRNDIQKKVQNTTTTSLLNLTFFSLPSPSNQINKLLCFYIPKLILCV